MSNFGMKISKSGEDVRTVSLKNSILNSDYSLFKIYKSDVASLTVPINNLSVITTNYAHGLSFIPAFQALVEVNEGGDIFYTTLPFTSGVASGYPAMTAVVDSANITFAVQHSDPVGAVTYNFKILIYYERIS